VKGRNVPTKGKQELTEKHKQSCGGGGGDC